jgi:hypothetical protein
VAANKNEDDYDGGKEDLWKFFLEVKSGSVDYIASIFPRSKMISADKIETC